MVCATSLDPNQCLGVFSSPSICASDGRICSVSVYQSLTGISQSKPNVGVLTKETERVDGWERERERERSKENLRKVITCVWLCGRALNSLSLSLSLPLALSTHALSFCLVLLHQAGGFVGNERSCSWLEGKQALQGVSIYTQSAMPHTHSRTLSLSLSPILLDYPSLSLTLSPQTHTLLKEWNGKNVKWLNNLIVFLSLVSIKSFYKRSVWCIIEGSIRALKAIMNGARLRIRPNVGLTIENLYQGHKLNPNTGLTIGCAGKNKWYA